MVDEKRELANEQWKNNSNSILNLSNPEIRNKIMNEHNNICDKCGANKNLIIHHNDYLFTDDTSHLSVLCTKCHGKLYRDLRKVEESFKGNNRIKRAMIEILSALNIDLKDENFRNTPSRVARSFMEMCEGLNAEDEIKEILRTKFPSSYEGMVISKNIEVWSLCPHHLLPVRYIVNVGILFNKECIGLSKIPRLVELLAKRPVLQETLTQEITDIIDKNLNTLGTICMIDGMHTCMQARGVKSVGATAITSSATGRFLNPDKNKNPKEEFLKAISIS
jgi:GTP cyclohydrolase I